VAGFEAAYEQDNLPKYLYNLALAYQKMGRTVPIRWTPTSDGLPGRFATDVRALAGTHRLTARIPAIMVTGDSSAPLVRACLRGGAVDYVLKPFDREYLLERVRRQIVGQDNSIAAA
jgi:CheY-like chemotaxis protein